MIIDRIFLDLGVLSYSIYIGEQICYNKKFSFLISDIKQCVLITDQIIFDSIKSNFTKDNFLLSHIEKKIVLQAGENEKNLHTVNLIISYLLKNSISRDATLIALGGGVIGDIVGFCASIYQRGINFIQIPTTLLAQVDASIGGKTGVNHIYGKNMIGSFWQPKAVLLDTNFLFSLPKKHIISGMAEIIKYAIIFDKNFFIWLEENFNLIINLSKKELLYCIKKCCIFKSDVVKKDEKEQNKRMILNLGHSFAHAIETHTGYSSWLHGEAVSVGIVMAAYLSKTLKLLSDENFFRIAKLFFLIGLPIKGPLNMKPNNYISIMLHDKKVIHGKMRLILPTDIGVVKIFSDISNDVVEHSIYSFQKINFNF